MTTTANGNGLDVTIITGMSGAGRSEAANVLEDLGFFVIDNLPPQLIGKVAELARGQEHTSRYAMVVDVRSGDFLAALGTSLEELKAEGGRARIVFLDAADDVLVRRYEATRRRHPLSDSDRVSDGITRERHLLEGLKGEADVIVDTSTLNVHELRDRLRELFADATTEHAQLQTSIVSFGYKHGLPIDVDLVFDCRFLPNPHWVEELRPLTGQDDKVKQYVVAQRETKAFLKELDRMFALLMPAYEREGKSYLSIGIGCTGGRHRSVAIAEELARIFKRRNRSTTVHHRDIGRV
jgi:RNase adapter protein RapZ